MKKTALGLFFSALVFVVASLALGADREKKPDGKPAASASMSKEPMYMATCPDPCSFSVQSHDRAEVVAMLKQHAKTQHNMALSDKEAEAMVKEVKDAKPMKK
jgi:predicted small metal-binding protein